MVNFGTEGGNRNKARYFDNISSNAYDPPILRCVAKTHEPVGKNGVPKSRPIIRAKKGLTTALDEMISDLVETIARLCLDPTEAQNIEKVMRIIEETSQRLIYIYFIYIVILAPFMDFRYHSEYYTLE